MRSSDQRLNNMPEESKQATEATSLIELGSGSIILTPLPADASSTGLPELIFSSAPVQHAVGTMLQHKIDPNNIRCAISVASIESLDVLARAVEALREYVKNYEMTIDKKQQTFIKELVDEANS